ncbi:hypothetical protein ACWDGI_41605 [Streptomyces sp. NPDC001220]
MLWGIERSEPSTAVTKYAKEAAKLGAPAEVQWAEGYGRMYGCGAPRAAGQTYRWTSDGTHIYAADSTTVPAEETYWTDENGTLTMARKGAAAQEWTLASWTPQPSPSNAERAVLLTGLFGPLGAAIADTVGL